MRRHLEYFAYIFISLISTVSADEFRIAGYLPDYRITEYELARCEGISDLILFSGQPTAAGGINLDRLSGVAWPDVQRFKTLHRIRLFLTIGGWDRSIHFGSVAMSERLRKEFSIEAKDLCLRYRLDGIDIDWEHPESEAEVTAYGLLLRQLHETLSEHGLLLSVTVASWQELPQVGIDAVNWVNLMAYDHNGDHATLAQAKDDVQKMLARGVPVSKLTLGLPFYGRDVEKRDSAMAYSEIVETFRPAASQDRAGRVFFNGPETIRAKISLARQQKLAGVMIWELGQDASGKDPLLRHVIDAAK